MIIYLVEMDGCFATANDYDECDCFVGICSTLENAQNGSITYLKDQCSKYGVEVDSQDVEYSECDDGEHHYRYHYKTEQGQTIINCRIYISQQLTMNQFERVLSCPHHLLV